MSDAPLAVVTGASSGIGLELARCAISHGLPLLVCAETADIFDVPALLTEGDVGAIAVQADLATAQGVQTLWQAIGDRSLGYLMANAGIGLGGALLEQDEDSMRRVIDLNLRGTTAVLHGAIRRMRMQGHGRILVTSSVAGFIPGSYQAIYNASKAYLDCLALGIRSELADSGVTVTCLRPGPTDTAFFDRAGMSETPVAESDQKQDPAAVAQTGFEAMMRGTSGVTPGLLNKIQVGLTGIMPDTFLSRIHRALAEPND